MTLRAIEGGDTEDVQEAERADTAVCLGFMIIDELEACRERYLTLLELKIIGECITEVHSFVFEEKGERVKPYCLSLVRACHSEMKRGNIEARKLFLHLECPTRGAFDDFMSERVAALEASKMGNSLHGAAIGIILGEIDGLKAIEPQSQPGVRERIYKILLDNIPGTPPEGSRGKVVDRALALLWVNDESLRAQSSKHWGLDTAAAKTILQARDRIARGLVSVFQRECAEKNLLVRKPMRLELIETGPPNQGPIGRVVEMIRKMLSRSGRASS